MVCKELIYLYVLVLFAFLWKETNQTVINPSNLLQNGQNVCSRPTTQVESYYTTTATTIYTHSTTRCGLWGWGRCPVLRPRTVYRTVQRTRSDSVKVIYCCTGWKKRYSTSRECTEAICSQGCDSNRGSCVSPNTCQCSTGWTSSTCVTDIDECATGNGGCDQICTNTPGSYQCSCNLGFAQSNHSCQAICSQGCDSCRGSCVSPDTCNCSAGWTGNTCVKDIDECATGNGGCDQICTNTPGSYQCSCNLGYIQSGHSCLDMNDCQTLATSSYSFGIPSSASAISASTSSSTSPSSVSS